MDNGKLLWATGDIHLKREKRKKSSDDVATNGDNGVFVLRRNVAGTDNIKDDGQQKTAAGNRRKSLETRKAN